MLTKNQAGGAAYRLSAKQALAQYAFTGTTGRTFYTSSRANLKSTVDLCKKNDDKFIAKTAVAAREMSYQKDMPVLLGAYLHSINSSYLPVIFSRIIDNGKQLKKFVDFIRSGAVGRSGLGTSSRNMIREWLANRSDIALMFDNIGAAGKTTLAKVIEITHPHPSTDMRSSMYAWILGAKIEGNCLVRRARFYSSKDRKVHEVVRKYDLDSLPERLHRWESFKSAPYKFSEPPKVPFEMLTSMQLDAKMWCRISENMSWQQLRQNLVELADRGIFHYPDTTKMVYQRLRDKEEISRSRVLPYTLLATYLNFGDWPDGFGTRWIRAFWQDAARYSKPTVLGVDKVPPMMRSAIAEAMEIALANVPRINGKMFICPDTSGSMAFPITGERNARAVTTKVRCVDVAGLIAAAFLRHNPMARVMPFSTKVHDVDMNPMDSIVNNAAKFASLGGGGTSCSEPLRVLNEEKAEGNLIILVSDNESWSDSTRLRGFESQSDTALMEEWTKFKKRNSDAKLVCIDLAPKRTSQAREDDSILCIGGFSDVVFSVIKQFAEGELHPDKWVGVIESVKL